MKRRQFIVNLGSVTLLLASGKLLKASEILPIKGKLKLRFIVASDGHYGQAGTDYDAFFKSIVSEINSFHSKNKAEFVVINGDLIHNEKEYLPIVKNIFSSFKMPVHVTQGNHDRVEESYWKEVLGKPFNYSLKKDNNAFIFASTSNIKGDFLSPDVNWMRSQLDAYTKMKNVFIFIHITPVKWTQYGIDAPELLDLFKNYTNIKGVFNGHDHEHDEIKFKDNIPYMFDGHFGGDWGVNYHGFRVVELYDDNSLLTYLMNPTVKINENKLG